MMGSGSWLAVPHVGQGLADHRSLQERVWSYQVYSILDRMSIKFRASLVALEKMFASIESETTAGRVTVDENGPRRDFIPNPSVPAVYGDLPRPQVPSVPI
eukprot:1148103-Pelagomonas_calceolata.AAC.3